MATPEIRVAKNSSPRRSIRVLAELGMPIDLARPPVEIWAARCIRKRRMNSCGESVIVFQRSGRSMR
jgi:hypothetical protein